MAKKDEDKAGQRAALLARLARLEDELGEHHAILPKHSSSCRNDDGQPEDKDSNSDDGREALNRGTTMAMKKGAVRVYVNDVRAGKKRQLEAPQLESEDYNVVPERVSVKKIHAKYTPSHQGPSQRGARGQVDSDDPLELAVAAAVVERGLMRVQSGIRALEAIIEECMPALRALNRDDRNIDDKRENPFASIQIDW